MTTSFDSSVLKTELTEEDLRLIAEIYDATTTPERPGIIIYKGPETADLFDEPSWKKMTPLGSWREVPGRGMPGLPPPAKAFRYIDMMFPVSSEFPGGIPVGCWERHVKKAIGENEYVRENSRHDIAHKEIQRLRSLCEGLAHFTDAQRIEDEKVKARMRRAEGSADQSATMEKLAKLLAAATAEEAKPTPPKLPKKRSAESIAKQKATRAANKAKREAAALQEAGDIS